jgi:hypothetical protein
MEWILRSKILANICSTSSPVNGGTPAINSKSIIPEQKFKWLRLSYSLYLVNCPLLLAHPAFNLPSAHQSTAGPCGIDSKISGA